MEAAYGLAITLCMIATYPVRQLRFQNGWHQYGYISTWPFILPLNSDFICQCKESLVMVVILPYSGGVLFRYVYLVPQSQNQEPLC
jgi:hypothetical protein